MEGRRALNYPPLGAMVRVIFRGESESRTKDFAQETADRLRAYWQQRDDVVRLLGPAPAPIARLRGRHRFHIMLQAQDKSPLQAGLREIEAQLKTPDDVQWLADVDPLDML
jgi:primosomal protein N' (replication factor Y)